MQETGDGASIANDVLLVPSVKRRPYRQLLAEDVSAEVVDGAGELVPCVDHGRDREDLIELFEREVSGLRHEQQNEDSTEGTPAAVPQERASRREGIEETGERQGDDKVCRSRGSAP